MPPVSIRSVFTLKKLLLLMMTAGSVVYLLLTNIIYIDVPRGCILQVIPAVNFEFNNGIVMDSLRLLKRASPPDYDHVCQRVSTIQTGIDCGGFGGGCHYPNSPREITVSTQYNDLAWTAAVIVHETCHAIQTHEKRSLDEDECHHEDDRLLRQIVIYR